MHGNLTRGGAVFFDGWLLINQAETGADTRECTRMAGVRGGASDGLFVGSSRRYFRQLFNLRAFRAGSSRTNDFTLGLLPPPPPPSLFLYLRVVDAAHTGTFGRRYPSSRRERDTLV